MRRRLILVIIVLALIAGGIIYAVLSGGKSGKEPSQLTGVMVRPALAERPILGVMIENSPPARPQTGLDDAGVVFETVTEGGITRYLALYQEKMPDVVGPIRSLRPYFLDWVMGFDAAVAHVGGSPKALKLADERDAKDLDQFKYSQPYYRISSRQAPHNVYARTKALRDLQHQLGYGPSNFQEFTRSKDHPSKSPSAPTVTINYSNPTYQAVFHYQKSTNSYVRYLAGQPQIDAATKWPITVKNVVVLTVQQHDSTVDAIGSGNALIFKDGTVREAHWQKTGYDTNIELTDNDGQPIPLNRGDTWIAAVPAGQSVNY